MSQSDQLNLSEHILTFLQNKFNSKPINNQLVQNLWQGYGEILKLQLENGESVILKSIVPANHDYESNSLRKFKMDSYQVEENFYKFMNEFMFVEGEKARIPKF